MFLKVSKFINGSLKNIIIQGGRAKWGWSRMAVCLDNLVGKRFWGPKDGFGKGIIFSDRSFIKARARVNEKEEVYQGQRNAIRGSLARSYSVKAPKRSWRHAVLIMRNSVSSSWKDIEHGLARELNSHHTVNPIAVDRAMTWSSIEVDKKGLEELGLYIILGVGEVCFERWTPDNQLSNSKIVYQNEWVGIQGLPINLWNFHVFKVIGQKIGGLLDVASCTANLSFLPYAIVQLRGNKGGFIQENLEIFCWGKKINIRFFLLNGRTT